MDGPHKLICPPTGMTLSMKNRARDPVIDFENDAIIRLRR